jgi:hypothetical protein
VNLQQYSAERASGKEEIQPSSIVAAPDSVEAILDVRQLPEMMLAAL